MNVKGFIKPPLPKERVPSALERTFLFIWKATVLDRNIPAPWPEFLFDAQRNWRFDFAWPHVRLAVELEGGQWSGGQHVRGKGLQRDCEKSNAANLAGWCVLRYTTDDMTDRPLQVVEEVARKIVSLTHGGSHARAITEEK